MNDASSNSINQNWEGLAIFNQRNINKLIKEDQRDFLELFLIDSEKNIDKIKQNKINPNIQELVILIHSIKGSARNSGAEQLSEYSRQVELIIRSGELINKDLLEKLENIYQKTIEQIQNFLDDQILYTK